MIDAVLCRSCGASVVWVKSDKTGRMLPLDAMPTERGNVIVLPSGRGVVLGTPADRAFMAEAGLNLYLSHHVTCARPPETKR